MNVFDKFIVGDCESIDWCFENTHFNERLDENGIKRDYIIDLVMNEEPLRYDGSGGEYEVIYEAPSNKDYSEIRLIFACYKNTIDLVTVMPVFKTNRGRNKFKDNRRKEIDKKRLKAIAKRR